MKMTKRTFGVSLLFILLFQFGPVFINSKAKDVITKKIEVNQTYVAPAYFKLMDGNKYISIDYDTDYDSQAELESYREENPASTIYPEITILEGEYVKHGSSYNLKTDTVTTIRFKNVKNLKNKVYSEIDREDTFDGSQSSLRKTKSGNYNANNTYFVYKSNKKIANSTEEFLKGYTYKPEKLE